MERRLIPGIKILASGFLFALASICVSQSACADDVSIADFYRGKTMKIVVGFGPGGGFDLYARLVARYMPKYIPGSPNIIVENRPGAGSLIAANTLYTTEPKDGTVLAIISEGLPLLQRLGGQGVAFDAAKFNWIGAAVQTTYACAARTDLHVTADDVIAGKRLFVAASDPGSSPYDIPAVLQEALKLNLKIVRGYRSTPVLLQSLERKETDATCSTLSTFIEPAGRVFLEGDPPLGRLFLILSSDISGAQASHPWVNGVPVAENLAISPQAKELLAAFNRPAMLHKPFVAPPQVPAERVAMLRRALAETFAGPEFHAEIQKSALASSPISAEKTEELVRSILDTPASTAAVLEHILK